MRFDKFTTTFQTALADAQSLAVTTSNPYVEPAHLLSAMLAQPDGPKALLSRAGANVARLQTALDAEIAKLPQVQGGEAVQPGPRADEPAAGDREGSQQARRPVHRQRDVHPRRHRREGLDRHAAEAERRHPAGARDGDRGGARRPEGRQRRGRGPARGAEEVHPRPDRARPRRQARPGDRPRRRDPSRHPGAAAADQEQPGADRRARRRQDGDRRGPGAAHRRRRGARQPEGQARARRSTWRCCSPAPSSAASSRSG